MGAGEGEDGGGEGVGENVWKCKQGIENLNGCNSV